VRLLLPTVLMSAAGMVADIDVALETEDASALPFHFTTYPVRKPVPVRVTARSGCPAVALDGETQVITGAGLMVNASALEATPSAVVTVM